MKKIGNPFILIIFLPLLISMENTEKTFHVYIEQNGKNCVVENNTITLQKKPFDIIFEFPEPAGILLNASCNPKTYDLAIKGISKHTLPGFMNTGMAEHLFNPDNEILLSFDAPSYWFYQNEQTHRFNSVIRKNGTYICRRTVEHLNDIDSAINIPVQEVEKPVYLVFILSRYSNGLSQEYELKREMIKINWK